MLAFMISELNEETIEEIFNVRYNLECTVHDHSVERVIQGRKLTLLLGCQESIL